MITAHQTAAQGTRADVIRQQQLEKQRGATPPRRNRGEAIIGRLEQWGIISGTPNGLYPWIGSMFPGGGFAAGPGLRTSFGDDGAVSVFGGAVVGEPDSMTPLGTKGVGELAITGMAAAVANAVYHATGIRVRSLPISIEKMLGGETTNRRLTSSLAIGAGT